jgi:hypothetical protein
MPKVILVTPMAEISEIDYSDYSSEKYFNQEWFESCGFDFEKNIDVMVGELPKGMFNCIASTLLSNKRGTRGTKMPIFGNAIFRRANEDGEMIDLSIKEFKKICKENGIKSSYYTVL